MLQTTPKSLVQNPQGRGYMNGNRLKLSNHSGEITYNVSLGINTLYNYTMLDQLKFATLEDAKEYVANIGATENTCITPFGKEYYAICQQDGCAFSTIGFYSIK